MSVIGRWAIVLDVSLRPGDVHADGRPAEATLERWFEAAWAAYLERAPRLSALVAAGRVSRELRTRAGREVGPATDPEVTVGLSVTELRPSSFDARMRVRGAGGEVVGEALARLTIADPLDGGSRVPEDVRRELLEIEQGATGYA